MNQLPSGVDEAPPIPRSRTVAGLKLKCHDGFYSVKVNGWYMRFWKANHESLGWCYAQSSTREYTAVVVKFGAGVEGTPGLKKFKTLKAAVEHANAQSRRL